MKKKYIDTKENPLKIYEKLIGNFVSDIIGIKFKNFKINSTNKFIIDSDNILEFPIGVKFNSFNFDRYYKFIMSPNDVLDFPISLNENIKNDKIRFFFEYTFYNFPNDNKTIKNLIKFYNIKRPTKNFVKRKQVFSVYLNKSIESKSIFDIFFPIKVKEVLVEDYIMIEERPYLFSELDEFSEVLQKEILKNFQLEINFKDHNEIFDEKLKILEMLMI